MTTVLAPISISESSPNPARATDRAASAAMARTTIPATFQASVAYSSAKPRRSKAFRSGSVTATSTSVPAERRPGSANPGGDGRHRRLERAEHRPTRSRVRPSTPLPTRRGEVGQPQQRDHARHGTGVLSSTPAPGGPAASFDVIGQRLILKAYGVIITAGDAVAIGRRAG